MSQDVKLHIFQQIHTNSGNQLTGSYFRSVTGYDTQTSFTALVHHNLNSQSLIHMCEFIIMSELTWPMVLFNSKTC